MHCTLGITARATPTCNSPPLAGATVHHVHKLMKEGGSSHLMEAVLANLPPALAAEFHSRCAIALQFSLLRGVHGRLTAAGRPLHRRTTCLHICWARQLRFCRLSSRHRSATDLRPATQTTHQKHQLLKGKATPASLCPCTAQIPPGPAHRPVVAPLRQLCGSGGAGGGYVQPAGAFERSCLCQLPT